jgi:hypothetical protein
VIFRVLMVLSFESAIGPDHHSFLVRDARTPEKLAHRVLESQNEFPTLQPWTPRTARTQT